MNVSEHLIEVFQAKRRQADVHPQVDARGQLLVGQLAQRGRGFGQVEERVVGALSGAAR